MTRVYTNIDLFMHKKGISKDKELAKELGWSQQQFSQKISGEISMKTLETIAAFFNVSVKELLR